jgi:alginate O-acetyltransferase complex protein AlgI
MLFNSFAFLFLFLPVALAGYFWIGRNRSKYAALFLAIMSVVFYGVWDIRNVPILLVSILFNFGAGIAVKRADGHTRTLILSLAVTTNLLALAWYKYADLLYGSFCDLLGLQHHALGVNLPLGISFFTFTQIAYLVDVSRRKVVETEPIHYGLFVTYFPHLIAGPVLHHAEMMPQFRKAATYRVQWEKVASGINIFTIGLGKKVLIADLISTQVNTSFAAASMHGLGTAQAWVAAFSYGWQIYFDFSGYSDMAIGLSRLFGVTLPLNFDSPYQSRSIIEFWRRWHMTLSRFLRDYLYFSLGGSRAGPMRRYVNLMVTMVLGGLWHGAGWNFALWGALHGGYLILNHGWRALAEAIGLSRLPTTYRQLGSHLGWALTLLASIVAFVPFRAGSLLTTQHVLLGMVGRYGPAVGDIRPLALCIGFGVIALLAPNSQTIAASLDRRMAEREWPAWPAALISVAAILCLSRPTQFLYFQF